MKAISRDIVELEPNYLVKREFLQEALRLMDAFEEPPKYKVGQRLVHRDWPQSVDEGAEEINQESVDYVKPAATDCSCTWQHGIHEFSEARIAKRDPGCEVHGIQEYPEPPKLEGPHWEIRFYTECDDRAKSDIVKCLKDLKAFCEALAKEVAELKRGR